MHSTARRAAALLGALTISLGATACSTSEPTATSTGSAAASTSSAPAPKAAEIVEKAKATALAATSGAFTGEVKEGGESMKIDFKGTKDGSMSDITIDMGATGKVRLLSVEGSVFMQGDAAFWKAQGAPAEVQAAGDKFIKAPADEAESITGDLTIASFLDEAFTELTPESLDDKVGEESIDGVDCWVVTDKKGKQEGALYVSKDKMELVRFTGSTDSPGQIDFSDWNADLGIKAPAADQVMDVS